MFLVPRAGKPMFAVAATVAFSRVMVNAHFVTDVAGGAALAIVTTYWLRAWFSRRRLVFAAVGTSGYRVRRAGRATKPRLNVRRHHRRAL